MEDLIRRSDALSCFHDLVYQRGDHALLLTIYGAIANLPSASPKAQWMPYPENEPEEGECYLVTAKYNGGLIVDIDDYYSHGWDDWGNAVIAWAELPEPYKEES